MIRILFWICVVIWYISTVTLVAQLLFGVYDDK